MCLLACLALLQPPCPQAPFRSIPGAELLPLTWRPLCSCVIVCVSSSSGAEFWGCAFPLGDAQAQNAPHKVEVTSLLPRRWLSYQERRWKDAQLELVTSDCRHQGCVTGRAKGEQHYFWLDQAVFSLQVPQADTRCC